MTSFTIAERAILLRERREGKVGEPPSMPEMKTEKLHGAEE